MIKNYLTIAWRNLCRHKLFSLINISGLAIGIAACMIIFIYVQHELTFDQYNSKTDRIVRITTTIRAPESDIILAFSPAPLAAALISDYPEVESATRLESAEQVVRSNNEFYKEPGFYTADSAVFSVFDFDFIWGSATKALSEPNEIVITEAIAKKYFGREKALGKTLICGGKNFRVTGVVKNRPANSDIQLTALMSKDYSSLNDWTEPGDIFTFVLLRRSSQVKKIGPKLTALANKYAQPAFNAVGATDYKVHFESEPLKDVHFSKAKLGDTPKGNRQFSYVFSALALIILLIALLNYVNLSTAKSVERAKEVGIRKVSGAQRFQLIRQFLSESFFIVALSWLIAIGLVVLFLPFLNKLLDTTLEISWVYALVFTIAVFLITFVLAGLYPAFVLSAFSPIKVLKGNWRSGPRGIWLRKAVTMTQFAITAALIMGTVVIYRQMKFIEKRDLGFAKDQLVNIYFPRDSANMSQVHAFRDALKLRPEVHGLTVGNGMMENDLSIATTITSSEGKKRELMCNYFFVDPDFLSVFQMKLAEGRNLSESFGTDKKEGFLVNEAFVKMMGWKSGLGKSIEGFDHKGKIIGVVKNFYYKSLHNAIEPLVMIYNNFPANTISARIKPGSLGLISDLHKTYLPSLPMNYSFFDDIISSQYRKDRVTMTLFTNFTFLSIFVSCLGLYGLVALIAVQRTKEIGIRKILGASVKELMSLLSKDFLKLLFLSLLVALPVIGVLSNQWLSSYAYHANLTWWTFAIPAVLLLLILLLVISKEIIKTALINPVSTLRSE
jgi:putative ABC transport system permease protein